MSLLLVISSSVSAQTFPVRSGLLVDQADLLDPVQEAAISEKLEAFDHQVQAQLVVATIADLEGYPIEDYGYRLGREWGIGDKDRNDGIIIIVAPNERKTRIEVGYGLEGVMTDALSSTIIQDKMIPQFKYDNMPGGITNGVDAIIAQLSLPEDKARTIALKSEPSYRRDRSNNLIYIFGGVFLFYMFFIFLVKRAVGKGKNYHKGNGSVSTWSSSSSSRRSSSSSSSRSSSGGSFGGGGASGSW